MLVTIGGLPQDLAKVFIYFHLLTVGIIVENPQTDRGYCVERRMYNYHKSEW